MTIVYVNVLIKIHHFWTLFNEVQPVKGKYGNHHGGTFSSNENVLHIKMFIRKMSYFIWHELYLSEINRYRCISVSLNTDASVHCVTAIVSVTDRISASVNADDMTISVTVNIGVSDHWNWDGTAPTPSVFTEHHCQWWQCQYFSVLTETVHP